MPNIKNKKPKNKNKNDSHLLIDVKAKSTALLNIPALFANTR